MTEKAASSTGIFIRIDASQSTLISDLAADQILTLVRTGELPVGSRLPPERLLAQQLGVSRAALREALRILGAIGVVEARVGRGRVVARRSAGSNPSGAVANWLQVHRHKVAEINHVLQLVAPAAMLEVPTHLLPQVAVDARAIYIEAISALEAADSNLAAELDASFHRVLLERTPNGLLREIARHLVDISIEHGKALYRIPVAAQHSLGQHLLIVEALERGSKEQAAQLLREHAAIGYRFAIEHSEATDMTPTD